MEQMEPEGAVLMEDPGVLSKAGVRQARTARGNTELPKSMLPGNDWATNATGKKPGFKPGGRGVLEVSARRADTLEIPHEGTMAYKTMRAMADRPSYGEPIKQGSRTGVIERPVAEAPVKGAESVSKAKNSPASVAARTAAMRARLGRIPGAQAALSGWKGKAAEQAQAAAAMTGAARPDQRS